MSSNEISPRPKTRAQSATPLAASDSTESPDNGFDYDKHIVDRIDESIWRAVYNGQFRLAVKCERCNRWLTSGHSKRHRLGPSCKNKSAER